jgi:hypothetical protein
MAQSSGELSGRRGTETNKSITNSGHISCEKQPSFNDEKTKPVANLDRATLQADSFEQLAMLNSSSQPPKQQVHLTEEQDTSECKMALLQISEEQQ